MICSMFLTLAKSEKPGYGISQNPRVSTKLEQIISEGVDEPEAEPANTREKKRTTRKDIWFWTLHGSGSKADAISSTCDVSVMASSNVKHW